MLERPTFEKSDFQNNLEDLIRGFYEDFVKSGGTTISLSSERKKALFFITRRALDDGDEPRKVIGVITSAIEALELEGLVDAKILPKGYTLQMLEDGLDRQIRANLLYFFMQHYQSRQKVKR